MRGRIFGWIWPWLTLLPLHGAEKWWRVFGEVTTGEFAGGQLEVADPELAELLAATEFPRWKTFEDELVSLRYPDHPGLHFEVTDGPGPKEDAEESEDGGTFRRDYLIRAGGATFGHFVVMEATWLDDGVCMCGPMIHDVYRVEDGCLARFSLLPGGAVKKAELLGDKRLLTAVEWTHLACQRPVYEEMVERMRLKLPHPASEEQLRQEVFRLYQVSGRAGWIHPGTPVSEVSALLGSEPERLGERLTWNGRQSGHPFLLIALGNDDVIRSLVTQGVDWTGSDSTRGRLGWIEEQLGRHADASPDLGEPTATLAEISQAVLDLGAEATPESWPGVARVMRRLADDHGLRDPRMLHLILERGAGTSAELQTLEALEYPGIDQWVGHQLHRMSLERPSEERDHDTWDERVHDRAGDATRLLRWTLEHDRRRFHPAIDALWETKEPAWMRAVLGVVGHCPAPTAQRVLEEGFARADDEKSMELLGMVFDALDEVELPDPEILERLIVALPEDEAGSAWERDKATALRRLGEMQPARESQPH